MRNRRFCPSKNQIKGLCTPKTKALSSNTSASGPSSASLKAPNYPALLHDIGSILSTSRQQACWAVNSALVQAYWKIGQRIVDYEQGGKKKAEYGDLLLDRLSRDLKLEYGMGFGKSNIYNMRLFYLRYQNFQTVSGKLSWSHYCLILRLDEPSARAFYIRECESENWSVRNLDRQINSMLFERLALSRDKSGILKLAKEGQTISSAQDVIKDPYVLEFLGLDEKSAYTETDLEQRIILNLQKFLLELGKGFAFVSRQQRITLEDEHFYIDLVCYNRLLRCFCLFELKIGKLEHKDLGQLQMYVNYYDRTIRQPGENPTIGILLCADKKDAVVRYTLPLGNHQIFASKYRLYLPERKQLEENVRRIIEECRASEEKEPFGNGGKPK